MDYILGIDVGTTATKCALASADGKICAFSSVPYETVFGPDGVVQQDARDWYKTLCIAVRECLEAQPQARVRALSLSTQGGSMVPVDAQGEPLYPVAVWMDVRAKQQAKRVQADLPEDYVYLQTGWPLNAGGNALQMLWLRDHETEIFNKTYKFLDTVQYVNYHLTGKFVGDYTNMGIAYLMDVRKKCYDPEILKYLGVNEGHMAELTQSGSVIGPLTPKAARDLGLGEDVLVVSGGHDQYCAALGAGSVEAGDIFLATGTAWVILATLDDYLVDTRTHFSFGNHVLPGMCGAMASLMTGGTSLEWYVQEFMRDLAWDKQKAFAEINRAAGEIPPGANGVVFYPHFQGTTCPTWRQNHRASLMGVELNTTRDTIARAVMEGVAYDMNWLLRSLYAQGVQAKRIKMVGGAAKSPVWPQIMADVTNLPLDIPSVADTPTLGALILAGTGCGIFDSMQQGAACFSGGTRTLLPQKEAARAYQGLFKEYIKRFEALEQYYG